jgi:hypothetical protein
MLGVIRNAHENMRSNFYDGFQKMQKWVLSRLSFGKDELTSVVVFLTRYFMICSCDDACYYKPNFTVIKRGRFGNFAYFDFWLTSQTSY